jgi:ankyrin repeat protein
MQDGMTPLLAATRDSWHGRPEAVMTLLANGADPRSADADGNTPLHHAARSSDPGVAALLRDAGADIDALNAGGQSPLGSACACGNWRLARFLLERGARPEPAGGQPALLAAAGSEEDDAAGVQLLLRHKAKANARDARGRSALHEAAAAGHAGICQALLDAGADVEARDGEGRTPLLDAARTGAAEALDVLLAAKADPLASDANGANALHLACAADNAAPELAQRLLALGIDPQARDAYGRSALDVAADAGRWSLVALLDPTRALPAALAEDDAAPPERPPLLQLREALLDAADPRRLAALAAALEPGDFDHLLGDADIAARPERLDWLLRQGANPELRAPGMPTPLDAALAQGSAGIATARLLFAHGASPAGGGRLARYLVACLDGADDGRGEAFALDLLARGADPFGPGPSGEPPMLLAVRLGWPALLQRLIALGADPDACDGRGMSALHFAATLGRKDALTALLAAGASPDRRAADGQTPLGIALASGQRELADWLDWRGWRLPRRPLAATDLPAAAVVGDRDAVRRLLDLGFPIDTTDGQGCTALLRAAGGGHRELVDDLLARGADPGLTANTGATALSAAVSMRHLEIVDRLLQAGCGLEQRLPGDVTVLMLAAALGLPELVSRLLQAGADLNAIDAQGLTPLHCAALYGFTARDRARLLALLDGLLLAGADPHRTAGNGTTPLLLLLGARAEPGTPSSEDVLLAALELLLEEGVRLDAQDPRGFGPLHLAALHGLQRTVQALLRAGADPDLRDNADRTPRDIALMRGYVDIAAELVPPAAPPPSGVSMARFLRE